jgi:hypothetical protein
MKRLNITRVLLYFVAFAAGLFLIIGAGLYRKEIPKETGQFKLDLSSAAESKEIKTIVYDIQNEGIPKRLVQPGRISIATGHGGGIANKGNLPLWLQFKTEGFISEVKVVSTDPTYDKNAQSFKEAVKPGVSKSVSVNFDIPRDILAKKYNVSEGNLIVLDSKSGKILAKVPFKIVNSKFRNDQKMTSSINFTHVLT